LKGSEKVVGLFQSAIAENKLQDKVTLSGSFCTGRCNREGVTVTVDDAVYIGITTENFKSFFEDKILKQITDTRR
jgi:NADH:ubiquinone oxidoreductase subunit E